MTEQIKAPQYNMNMPNHSVSSQPLTLPVFWEMNIGEILVSPTGNLFVMGDIDLANQIIELEPADVADEVIKIEFEDVAGTIRQIVFIDGRAIGYDVLLINHDIPMDTTGICIHESDDTDSDFSSFNEFVSAEIGETILNEFEEI